MFVRSTGPRGLEPVNQDVRVINRKGSTITAGDLVQFDVANASTQAGGTLPGATDWRLACVVQPNGYSKAGLFGIALEDIADDAEGLVRVRGKVKANVLVDAGGASTPISAGPPLFTINSDDRLHGAVDAANATDKCLGLLFQDVTLRNAEQKVLVLFDGVQGFGWRG